MRVVFMGTPEFALPCLERLVGSYEVVAVYTRPDQPAGRGRGLTPSPVKSRAQELGLPVVQPPTLRDAEVVAGLAGFAAEAIIVAGYGLLLPPAVLALPRHGCLNLHPSLLPRHRGPSPIPFAILRGDDITGVSLMLLDQGMDTGPVLAQSVLPLSSDDTTESLTRQLSLMAAALLMENLPRWVVGELQPVAQEESKATYTRPIAKREGELDFHLPAIELGRRVRAFHPWPGAFTRFKGKVLKVLAAQPLSGGGEPGRVVAVAGGVGVATPQGVLQLLRVQLEGKRPLPIEEFLRGRPDLPGARLG